MAVSLASLLSAAATPPPIGRDDAARAAREELQHAIYRDERSWFARLMAAIGKWLGGRAGDATNGLSARPGLATVIVVVLVALLVVAVAFRSGAWQRNVKPAQVLEFDAQRSAADHRRVADQYAADGKWRDAVRERLRAIVRELEERTLLDERPGRTASEIAAEAGAALPSVAADLRMATGAFAEVWYGDRDATAATDATMRSVDERVRAAARGRASV